MTVWLLVFIMSGNTLASNKVFDSQIACETYRIHHNFPTTVRCVGFIKRAST